MIVATNFLIMASEKSYAPSVESINEEFEKMATGIDTPPTEIMSLKDIKFAEEPEEVVPWHGNMYLMLEKGTGKAITRNAEGGLYLTDESSPNPHNRWLCVETNGWFGFYNTAARVYMGHDGKRKIHAWASQHKAWEFFNPRQDPLGGYQLLSPYDRSTVYLVCSVDDEMQVIMTRHGETLWEFVKV